MKKKVWLAIGTAALAAVMCTGLVACGNDSDKDDKQTDSGEIVSDQVTAEEWEAAFSEENFANCKMEYRMDSDAEYVFIRAGEYEHVIATNSVNGQSIKFEAYVDYSGAEDIYYVKKGENRWEKSDFSDAGTLDEVFRENVADYKEAYDSFSYSVEEKGYVLNSEDNIGTGKVVLKFGSKKIASIQMELGGEGQNYNFTIDIVFTYGGQSVTLPQIFE